MAPCLGYNRICPADFESKTHNHILSAVVVRLKRTEAVRSITRAELETVIKESLEPYKEDTATVARMIGPEIHNVLDRVYFDDPPDIVDFLRIPPAEEQKGRSRTQQAPGRRRSSLERWLCGQRMGSLTRRYPARTDEDEFLEGIAQVAAIELGASNKVVVFDSKVAPPRTVPSLWLQQTMVAKAGNLTAVQAPPKTGKSAVVGAILASTTTTSADTDCLEFRSGNPNALAVLHFDTEQDQEDHHELVCRALRRAGADQPPWLKSFWIRELAIKERLACIRESMAAARREFGGIRLVIVDGVADLCSNVNDPEEALAVVHELLRLSSEFRTAIVCVLHENPGTEIGKTRGHLGSELERKSMSNIRLQKDADGVVTIWGEKMRKCEIPKSKGPRFRWNDAAGMHLTYSAAAKEEDDAGKLRTLAQKVFAAEVNLPYSRVLERIRGIEGVGQRTAKTRFSACKEANMLRQCGEKKGDPWSLGPAAVCPERLELAFKVFLDLGRTLELSSWLLCLPEGEHFSEAELMLIADQLVSTGHTRVVPGKGWISCR